VQPSIIFITGTDTGVGKTLITSLLLRHLRENGHRAFAIKPFCSGGRADAELLHSLQDDGLSLEQINPFYFPEPLAPFIAAEKSRRRITLENVVRHIQKVRQSLASKDRNTILLIEGAGGLLVPLGRNFTWREIIQELGCGVLLVAANRLGTINHTLLTTKVSQAAGNQQLAIVLTCLCPPAKATPDMPSNGRLICAFLDSIALFQIPFLGPKACHHRALKKNAKKLKKTLAGILACYKLSSVASRNQTDNKKKK